VRLLSAQAVDQERKKDQADLAQKGLKMVEAVETVRKELNTLKVTKEQEKARIQADFEAFLASISQKQMALSNGLAREVEQLEARKQEALQPVQELKAILESQKSEYEALIANFEAQEATLKQKEQAVDQEFTKIALLQGEMDKERERFDYKLLELKAQENTIKDLSSKLQTNWQDFTETVQKSGEKLQSWEQDIAAHRKSITVLQEEMQKQRKDIELNRAKLVDLQSTIRAAFEEARSKNLL
jgi:chromosome segregation ATPase